MGHITRAIEIMAPAEKVFDVLVDPDRLAEWATIVVRTERKPAAPLQSGDTFRQTMPVAGKEIETAWRVVDLERPRRMRYEATGPEQSLLRMEQTVTEAVLQGSRVELDVEYRLPSGIFVQFMDWIVVKRQNEHEAERSLQHRKQLVEGSNV